MRSKIKNLPKIKKISIRLKSEGKKIVFTNGCFDIIHRGHVEYIKKAKELGDILIVGLNTDASVKRLKGSHRPINNQSDRAIVLSSLEMVDYVVFFSQDTPIELIKLIKPHILAKGGDWKPKAIAGALFVKSCGGKVLSIPFIKGYSTSRLVKRIKSL